MLLGLADGCPYHRADQSACALDEIRARYQSQWQDWVSDLTDEDCQDIYRIHLDCQHCHRGALARPMI